MSRFSASGKVLAWAIAVVLILAAAGTAGYFYNRYQNSQKEVTKLKSNPTVVAQTEAQQLMDKVGKLTDLPKGETPTIATVTDITKLKGQVFFDKAKNGDKVLIYTQAKEAILYRPSTDKIINIAPVNIGNNQQAGTQNTGTSQTNNSQTPSGTNGR